MEHKREKFSFYWNFKETINDLPTDAEKLQFYEAITEYVFFDKEPENLTPMGKMGWRLIKQILTNAINQYDRCKQNGKLGAKHGAKGGAPKGNQNARKNRKQPQEQPQEQPQVIYELSELFEYVDNKGEINWEVFEKEIRKFGKTKKIPKQRVEEFIQYNFNNWVVRVDELGTSKLYDKEGNELKNWKGALIKFAGIDYDKWKDEHGYYVKPDYKRKR